MKWLRKTARVILLLILLLTAYVSYANRNSINMTSRQKITKAFYPALMWFTKLAGINTSTESNKNIAAPVSFYTLQSKNINGVDFDFTELKGQTVLIVNTASDCGYTDQYADLQKLYTQYKGRLVIIAFPANDFKEQEKGSDHEIAAFCQKNYGVTFPVMSKSVVVKSADQHPVFKWLTDTAQNGWNSKAPGWNFSKYIVNGKGQLTHYFDPGIAPLSKEMIAAIDESKP